MRLFLLRLIINRRVYDAKIKVRCSWLRFYCTKAYLPVLTKEENWELVGAFSPNQSKAKLVCDVIESPCLAILTH